MPRKTELDLENVNWEEVARIFAPEKESFLSKVKKGIDKYPRAKEALLVLAGLGIVSLGVLVPGLAMVVAKEIRQQEKDNFKKRLRRFAKDKLVSIKEVDGETVVEITEAGLKRALHYKLETMTLKKPGRWDGLWRIVIFDVDEKKRTARDRFRDRLKTLGFYMINESVFVYPYPCFDEVEFLRQVSGVGREVTWIVASSIETAADLEEHFFRQN